jgi:hypothetical protein
MNLEQRHFTQFAVEAGTNRKNSSSSSKKNMEMKLSLGFKCTRGSTTFPSGEKNSMTSQSPDEPKMMEFHRQFDG